jgi:hypothetical protein
MSPSWTYFIRDSHTRWTSFRGAAQKRRTKLDTPHKIEQSYRLEMELHPRLSLDAVARRAGFTDRRHMRNTRKRHLKDCPPPPEYLDWKKKREGYS